MYWWFTGTLYRVNPRYLLLYPSLSFACLTKSVIFSPTSNLLTPVLNHSCVGLAGLAIYLRISCSSRLRLCRDRRRRPRSHRRRRAGPDCRRRRSCLERSVGRGTPEPRQGIRLCHCRGHRRCHSQLDRLGTDGWRNEGRSMTLQQGSSTVLMIFSMFYSLNIL